MEKKTGDPNTEGRERKRTNGKDISVGSLFEEDGNEEGSLHRLIDDVDVALVVAAGAALDVHHLHEHAAEIYGLIARLEGRERPQRLRRVDVILPDGDGVGFGRFDGSGRWCVGGAHGQRLDEIGTRDRRRVDEICVERKVWRYSLCQDRWKQWWGSTPTIHLGSCS